MSKPIAKSPSVYHRVFTRDGHRCVYCDRDILDCFDTFAASHLDHLKPAKFGGADDDEFNRVTACGVCNSIKGSFDPSPDGPVTPESFAHVVEKAREFVLGKRRDPDRCSYVRDYEFWLKESGRVTA